MTDVPIPEQRVFSIGSSRGTMGKEGLEQMKKNRRLLFPDMPEAILEHPKLCNCALCGEYFGEQCPKCLGRGCISSSQRGRSPDSPLGFECEKCTYEW